ncbi:MAG: LamG-like jellyroll fold domain-containing protein [Planctomycetota bacterium]
MSVPPQGASQSFKFPVESENWYRLELTDGLTGEKQYRYFRPDANCGERPVINISGEWQALPVKTETFSDPPADSAPWRTVWVPQWYNAPKSQEGAEAPGSAWGLAQPYMGFFPQIPGAEEAAHRAWFRKRFEVPDWWRGNIVELSIGANHGKADVYLNGQLIGKMHDPFAKLQVDVTDHVRFGGTNELLMAVQDRTAYVRDDFKPGPDGKYPPTVQGAKGTFVGMAGYAWGGLTVGGPWQEVFVRGRPSVSISDTFVISRVSEGRLRAEVGLSNQTESQVQVRLCERVYCKDELAADLGSIDVALKPNEEKVVALEKPVNLALWDFDTPVMHRLETTVFQGNKAVDIHNTRFGYREIATRGADFVLNGKPVHFFRMSLGMTYYASILAPSGLGHFIEHDYKRSGVNLARTTVHPPDPFVAEVADDVGFVLDIEGCWSAWQATDLPAFWENARQHWRGIAKRFRNNPSVLLYSLGNECIHPPREERDLPESVYGAAKEVDPTRLYGFDDDTDYLRESMDYICVHYPYSVGRHDLWPDSAFWWQTPMPVRFDRHPGVFDWKRDKPVIIGEMNSHCYAFPPHGYSAILGPSAYERIGGKQGWFLGQGIAGPMAVQGARLSGVSGTDYGQWGDWGFAGVREPVCALLREMDHTFYEKEGVTRTFAILNGLRRDEDFRLVWRLKDAGAVIASGEAMTHIAAGGREDKTVNFTFPGIATGRAKAVLEWELWDSAEVVYRDEQALDVFPRPEIALPEGLDAVLFDPDGATSKAIERTGLSLPRINSIEREALSGKDLLIIGEDALSSDGRENPTLLDFAHGGGRVVVFKHDTLAPPAPMPLKQESDYEVNTAFVSSADHPLLAGLEKDDFRYWRGRPQEYPPHEQSGPRLKAEPTWPLNHQVCVNAFVKPVYGNYRVLLESGGTDGLRWTPLVEFPVGDGAILLCQLLLGDCLGREPAADKLVSNILDWASHYRNRLTRKLTVWAPCAPKVLAALETAGVPFTESRDFPELETLGKDEVLLIDGGEQLPEGRLSSLKTWLANGGVLWIHGLKPARQTVEGGKDERGLVGWWRLDEESWQGSVAADSSGRQNTLKPGGTSGAPRPTNWAKGRGAQLDGRQYFAGNPASRDFKVGKDDFTLEAWVNPADLEARSGIVGMGVSDYGTSNYGFYQRGGKYHFIVNGQTLINGVSPNAVTAAIQGGWHHLVGVRRKTGLSLYIDGELAAQGGTGDVDPDEDGDIFLIGAGDANNEMTIGAFFKGEIDDVRLYKGAALSDDQIMQRYQQVRDAKGQRLGVWSDLLPNGIGLTPCASEDVAVLSASGLVSGLSNYDLWLRQGYYGEGARDTTVRLADLLGQEVTGLDGLVDVESCLQPAGLARFKMGQGSVVMDQLLWEEACPRVEDKGCRILSTLATNLGLRIVGKERPSESWRYKPIQIETYCNRALSKLTAMPDRPPLLGPGDNDLRELPVGAHSFAGVEMRVRDHAIVLGGRESDPEPGVSPAIPIDDVVDKLVFLHTAVGSGTGEIGRYVIKYGWGKPETVPIVMGDNIADWRQNPRDLPHAKVAWTGKNPEHDPVSVYLTEWTPTRTEPIRSVTVESDTSGPKIILLALSTAKKERTAASAPAYTSYRPLDLSAVVNCGLTTDTEPRWPDAPKNDLREFETGEVTLAGIPARVTPGTTSCLVMWSQGTTDCPKLAHIDVGAPAEGVFFLHTSIYGNASWVYRVVYEDGKKVDVPVAGGTDVWDWYTKDYELPPLPRHVRVAWRGVNHFAKHDVKVYWYEWKNPHPETPIKAIEIIHEKDERSVPIVLGITLAAK